MVKGNWERRAELVAARRIEERTKKAQKLVGSKQFATAESVITKILRDCAIEQAGTRIEAWIEQDPSIEVCRSWLRTEKCPHKKCKFVHDSNVAHLRGVIFSDVDDQPTEQQCAGPYELASIAKKDYVKLRFLAVGGLCVYDYQYPEVWSSWYTPRIQVERTEAGKPMKLGAIKECTEEHGHVEDAEDALLIGDLALSSSQSKSSCNANFSTFFLHFEHQSIVPFATIFANLVPFLSNSDVVRASVSSKALLQYCNKLDLYRLRRKEGLSALAVELSKAKKAEQKKKIKQANVKKESKKDGFARGGNG